MTDDCPPFDQSEQARGWREIMLTKCSDMARDTYRLASSAGEEQPVVVVANCLDPVGRQFAVSRSGEARVEGYVSAMKAARDGGSRVGEAPQFYLTYTLPLKEVENAISSNESMPVMREGKFLAIILDYRGADWWHLPIEAPASEAA